MKKITCLLSCLLVLGCTSSAFAWSEWNYAGGSHSWDTAANWGGAVPTASDDPIMRDAGAGGYAEVGTGVNAVGGTMWMYGGGQADLNVNGGTLTLSQLRIGVDAGDKTVNVSNGSTLTLNGDSTVGQGGNGILNISSGMVNQTAGWFYVGFSGSGIVNLDGGTLSVPFLQMNNGASALMDIAGGTLIIKDARPEDIAFQINWYAGNGFITAYGANAVGKLNITTDQNNYTVVSAIPEPVTMLLLGLGGLFIRRK